MATPPVMTIGTRASPLAMAQAREAHDLLAVTHPDLMAPDGLAVVKIKTTGDRVQDRHLAEIGGKGLFAKELDAALLRGRVDLAVHSLKDLETRLPDGIILAACLAREDPRDALIGTGLPGGLQGGLRGFDNLPRGAIVGTASLRRQAQLLHRRPDIRITLLRGNIQTRIRKIEAGEAHATFLALAGLNRMGAADKAACILGVDEMMPACGQGVIAITCRAGDDQTLARLSPINHAATMTRARAERAMLETLDGTCQTPIGGLATIDQDDQLSLKGLVARPDGTAIYRTSVRGPAADATAIGREAGRRLRADAGDAIFAPMKAP